MTDRNAPVRSLAEIAEEASLASETIRKPQPAFRRAAVATNANKAQILQVLTRAARDRSFTRDLMENGAWALDIYKLTSEEKAAILCGDIRWIEDRVGPLSDTEKAWLNMRLAQESW